MSLRARYWNPESSSEVQVECGSEAEAAVVTILNRIADALENIQADYHRKMTYGNS